MSERQTSTDILGGVMSVVVAILFGNWINDVFDLGWEVPSEWIAICWLILAGSLFAVVFIILFALIIAGILATKDRY